MTTTAQPGEIVGPKREPRPEFTLVLSLQEGFWREFDLQTTGAIEIPGDPHCIVRIPAEGEPDPIEALRACVKAMGGAVEVMGNSPCRFDHHGACQEHGWTADEHCPLVQCVDAIDLAEKIPGVKT